MVSTIGQKNKLPDFDCISWCPCRILYLEPYVSRVWADSQRSLKPWFCLRASSESTSMVSWASVSIWKLVRVSYLWWQCARACQASLKSTTSAFLKSTLSVNSGLRDISGSQMVFRKLREVGMSLGSKGAVLRFYSFMQLLDLFVNKEWSTYVSEYSNPSSKYRSVDPQMVHNLLFK